MTRFGRLSLAQRFSLLSFTLIFGAMLAVGTWTGRQIEGGVIHRTADLTALYVDSLLAHHLQGMMQAGGPDDEHDEHAEEVKSLLEEAPLGRSLAGYKIWSPDGRIIYSSEPGAVGLQFPVQGGLAEALSGSVHTEISKLTQPEQQFEAQRWARLIETYAPLSGQSEGEIIGAIEFYQTTDALEAQIRAAQLRSWLVLGFSGAAIFLLLARLIYRASTTIDVQQKDLQEKVEQLSALLSQNEQLHLRVSRAAARTTALNERFLSRISADLHDGPGQDLALALLRIDELAEICEACQVALRRSNAAGNDFRVIRSALTSALTDLRATLAGLRLPEIGQLSPGQTAERAVRDFEQKTGTTVAYSRGEMPDGAPLSVKITLYRILQEALSNGYRHAEGAQQRVTIEADNGELHLEIADEGGGFDPDGVAVERLGLLGMRERVEILGGSFEVNSAPGRGTVVRTRLPLDVPEEVRD